MKKFLESIKVEIVKRDGVWLFVHLIDLKKNGKLKKHVTFRKAYILNEADTYLTVSNSLTAFECGAILGYYEGGVN